MKRIYMQPQAIVEMIEVDTLILTNSVSTGLTNQSYEERKSGNARRVEANERAGEEEAGEWGDMW